jgi:two-component system response regulator DevR
MVAEGLASLLSEEPDVSVAGIAASVSAAVAAAESLRPDVVLMDYRLPDGEGTTAAQRIHDSLPEIAIVFLSAEPSDDAVLKAVEAGACGFISKEVGGLDLTATVLRAAAGEFLLPAATLARLLNRQRENRRRAVEHEKLEQEITAREKEILLLMSRGLDNHAIAYELGIAYATVRTHVRSVLSKLDSRSRLQAVIAGRERGLIS